MRPIVVGGLWVGMWLAGCGDAVPGGIARARLAVVVRDEVTFPSPGATELVVDAGDAGMVAPGDVADVTAVDVLTHDVSGGEGGSSGDGGAPDASAPPPDAGSSCSVSAGRPAPVSPSVVAVVALAAMASVRRRRSALRRGPCIG